MDLHGEAQSLMDQFLLDRPEKYSNEYGEKEIK